MHVGIMWISREDPVNRGEGHSKLDGTLLVREGEASVSWVLGNERLLAASTLYIMLCLASCWAFRSA